MVSQTVLVVSGRFTEALSGEAVARAIARGLIAGGLPAPDLCPIVFPQTPGSPANAVRVEDVTSLLGELDFDARMRSSRAVVLAQGCLEERTLRGSAAFEIATRARQGGVPAYAVVGENRLAAFDARIMDLQAIFEADNARALTEAGRKLARIL